MVFWLVKSAPYPWPPISGQARDVFMAVQLRQVNGEAAGGAFAKSPWPCWEPILWQMGWWDMGVSENSVPLNPMVNDHYPY